MPEQLLAGLVQVAHTLFWSRAPEKNVGGRLLIYLQQLLPSQHAGLPQQVSVVAALADNESKRAAANASAMALSFIR